MSEQRRVGDQEERGRERGERQMQKAKDLLWREDGAYYKESQGPGKREISEQCRVECLKCKIFTYLHVCSPTALTVISEFYF